MYNKKKFECLKLKGKLGEIRDWLKKHNLPPALMFILLGVISTIWFLIRVIPKPSRAGYPCMKVAAPFMSGFIVYLITLGGITIALRKLKKNLFRAKYLAAGAFLLAALAGMVFALIQGSQNLSASNLAATGPDDGPNQPFGTAVGAKPGRVVWIWDKEATNENSVGYFYAPENTNNEVVSKMIRESVTRLTGKTKSSEAWDDLFRDFNKRKKNINKGYTPGEKIFIKINQTSARSALSKEDRVNGFYLRPQQGRTTLGTCQTGPAVVLGLLRQLVNEAGVPQENIAIGDPQNHVFGHNADIWRAEFPDIIIVDKVSEDHGRTLIKPTVDELIFYSDKLQTDRLFDVIENADYMINVANFKPHLRAGITLMAKNHFGSHSRSGAYHLHYSLVSPVTEARPTNNGYNKYRVFVDIMGSKYLGQNTVLNVVDGLFAGGAGEGGPPVKYFMAPFNNDYCNSIFMSQDQVALESVCYDFLRAEWNGTFSHDPSNNRSEIMPSVKGVDDYLHQAADPANWPAGILYDPDNSGKPLSSLGIHEHWNNPEMKQYSRNMGKSYGIELISIPDELVGPKASKFNAKIVKDNKKPTETASPVNAAPAASTMQMAAGSQNVVNLKKGEYNESKFTSVSIRPLPEELKGKRFLAGVVDDNNGRWFLTDAGIVNSRFMIMEENKNIPVSNFNDFNYELALEAPALWIATSSGAYEIFLPIEAASGVVNYNSGNSSILSDRILAMTVGRNNLRWFGTDQGISALKGKKWLTPVYEPIYPKSMFRDFPITAMATSRNGDSLYAATIGAGVTRVFRNEVDAISGASQYAEWGPIHMPSDDIYSICIIRDSIQWFGTDKGVARHIGFNTLENWTVFDKENGLVDDFVQTIAVDGEDRVWFGTKGGISVYDGKEWITYTVGDGLISNNILCIFTDKNGSVNICTDNGLMVFNNGALTCYR